MNRRAFSLEPHRLSQPSVGRKALWLVVLMLCLQILEASPQLTQEVPSFPGKVVGVTDGDTITVLMAGQKQVKIRLFGIDCPERGADFSRQAKQFTSDRVFGKEVEIIPHDTDRYGRTVATVLANGADLSLELVIAGLAWHFVKYAPNRQDLAMAEKEARMNRRGLWSVPNPIAPWDTRGDRRRRP